MLRKVIGGMVLAAASASPIVTLGQVFPGAPGYCPPPAHACHSCQQVRCNCQTTRPVVETTLRPEKYVTHRNVTEYQQHQEACTRVVPVTKYQDVTVDEGHYQTVWVSKPVTKKVAQTSYEQRVEYRTVTRPVTRQIAEVHTRMVPQQTVRYVPQQTQVVFNAPAAPCNTCAPLTTQVAPTWTAMAPSYPTTYMPQTAAIPSMPPITVPSRQASRTPAYEYESNLTPDAGLLDTPTLPVDPDWTTVPGRSTNQSSDRLGGYEIAPTPETTRAEGKFVPAPSAATVWSSRFSRR